jgi:hypothetical protein
MPQNRKSLKFLSQDKTESSNNNPVTLERMKLLIAVTSLVAAIAVGVFSVYQSHLQLQRLQTVTIAVRDTEDIRAALQKPFEGVWQYKIVFSRYFGQDACYISTGTAIFLWEPTKRQYQIFIGYSISKEWQNEKVVTGFLGGTLQADELGWPPQGVEMPVKYLERTGIAEFASPLAIGFTFTKGEFKKSQDGKQAVLMVMHYENSRSLGTMTLSR